MYYLNVFLSYSIIGYIFELIVDLILNIKPKSGIMFGPWTPIYGFGVLLMLFIHHILKKKNFNKFLEIFLYFIIIIVLLSALEQLGGVLLDTLFNKTLWDYSNLKFHLSKYVALEISLGWGIGAILIVYVIHPYFKKLLTKIPFIISALTFIVFIIDAIMTFLKYI